MSSAIVINQHARRDALSALERTVVGILAAMALIWTVFQAVEIQALFPPIGILYALGSIVVAAVILLGRGAWSPALAAGWGMLMAVPESIPAIGHLTDWSEIYTHFGHYLIIMTFFPLAITLVGAGIGARVQNRRREGHDRPAPTWLRTVIVGVVTLIVVANAVVIALYTFDIP